MLARVPAVLLVLLVSVLATASPGLSQATGGSPEVHPGLVAEVARLGPGEVTVALAVHERGQTPGVIRALDRAGVAHADLERVGVSQLLLDEAGLEQLRHQPSIASLWPEQRLDLHLAESVPMIGAPQAWEDHTRGEGATVLVIDTGVDAAHPDLVDRVKRIAQPHDPAETGLVPVGYSEAPAPASNDWFGHGTHVSGIVAGTGAAAGEASPQHGKLVGVAPSASLAVWSIPGLGNADTVFQAVQGFEYALEKQDELGIQVITNSWGQATAFDPDHPINVASLEAYRAGMSIVFSVGNSGEAPEEGFATNGFSTAPWVLAVAAGTKDGQVASFSSRGHASPDAPPWDRPDVIAPGEAILAAKSRTGVMQALGPTYAPDGLASGDPLAQATHYQYASGTSMSAPHVAGVLALMHSVNPALSPDQAYDLLVRTADPFPGDLAESGIGQINASKAVTEAAATRGDREGFLAGDSAYDVGEPYDHDPVAAALADGESFTDRLELPLSPTGRDGTNVVPGPGLLLATLAATLAALALPGRRP